MRTSFAHIHVGQKFLLENVAAAFSKGVARGSITKIYGLIISWGSSRMICCDWNYVWRAWASAGCVTATKARKIYLHCLLSTQMIGSDTLPRHKQWRNALGFCVLSDREGGNAYHIVQADAPALKQNLPRKSINKGEPKLQENKVRQVLYQYWPKCFHSLEK